MRFILFILLVPFTLTAGVCQNILSGKVTNLNNESVSSVNITISPFSLVTVTDENGLFKIKLPKDTVISLEFSHIEYQKLALKIDTRTQTNIAVKLAPSTRLLNEVQVTDTKEKTREQASLTKIDPQAAKVLPSAFNDFSKIISTLPGVTSNNELSSTYSVRGGNFDENLVYVNDIEIYRPFLIRAGQQEGLSFINPDLVENIEFSSGGWQPKYGDKLSSSLNIQYKKPTEFAASVTAGLLGGAAHVEGAAANKRISYVAGVRHKRSTYLLNTLEVEGEYFPQFTDVQSYININLNKSQNTKNKTDLGILLSYAGNRYLVMPENRETKFGTWQQSFRLFVAFDGKERMEYDNWQGGIKLSHLFGDKAKSNLIISGLTTREREYFDIEGGYRLCDVNNDISSPEFDKCANIIGIGTNYSHARNRLQADITTAETRNEILLGENGKLEFGLGYSWQNIQDEMYEYSFVDSSDYVEIDRLVDSKADLQSNRIFGYAQHTFNLDSVHLFTAGVRLNYWDLNNQFLVSPRIQYAWKPRWERDLIFRIATGYYQQPPFFRELRDFDGNLNMDLKAQTSIHAIAGMDLNFIMWGRLFKIVSEAYYKSISNVIPYDVDNVRIRYYAKNNARAYATGLDFRINGEFIKGAESWFSLGVLSTKEDIEDDGLGYIRRPSDQRINLGIFFQDHIPNNPSLRVFLNMLYGTGLPFGPPNNPRFRNLINGEEYRRLDVGFSKELNFRKEGKKELMESLWLGVEILNLLGSDNPISYTWINDVSNRQFAVPNSLSARFFNIRVIARI